LGGAGFMGSHLVDALVERGHNVRVFDRPNVDTRNLTYSLKDIDLYSGDITNEVDLAGAIRGMETLVHLVSTTIPQSSNDNPIYDAETNIVGSLKLLTLALELGIKKVIFASSGGTVYGIPNMLPIPETHATNPICAYGIAKLTIEKYLNLFNHLYGLEYAVLRIANPFGERQNPLTGQGAVSTFLWKTLVGEPITIWGDGSVARDYLHISDVIPAFVRVTEAETPSRTYNLGSGKAFTLNEIISAIAAITGTVPAVQFTPARRLDVPVNYLDISQARKELGWAPKLTLEQGMAKTWAWLNESAGR
jgi:UDP-glucose 4-epimerase